MLKKTLAANRTDYGTLLAKLGLVPMDAEDPLRAAEAAE
jgi:hypothetical protein